jgi:hypothetical protein
MSTGDYIAIVSYSQWAGAFANATNGYNQFGSLKKSFESIGLNMDTLFPGCTYSLLGRKGLAVGKAKFNVNHICNPAIFNVFSLKTAMISNAPADEMYDYPSCYEKYIYKLDPYVNKPRLYNSTLKVENLKVWPNPSIDGIWNLRVSNNATQLEVLDIVGKKLHTQPIPLGLKEATLNASDFEFNNQHGLYFLRVFNAQGQLIATGKAIK